MVAVPRVGAAMERRYELRLAMRELDAQKLGEEAVEAEPLVPVVERHEEEVRAR